MRKISESKVREILEAIGVDPDNDESGIRRDSNATAALTRQLEHVKSKTYDILYANLKARQFIPESNEVDPGAETIVTREWNHTGMAEIISNYADDLPLVDAFVNENVTRVQTIGSAYQYTVQDMQRAVKAANDLDGKRANAARLAIERKIDRIAAIGDASTNLRGLLNHPNVPLVTLPTGTWASATADQILTDMHHLAQSVVNVSAEVHEPDTMLLTPALFGLVNSKRVGLENSDTILTTFLKNSPYIKNVDQWNRLNTADAGGTGPRIMVYTRDPNMVELEIPLAYDQLPPQARNLAFVVPCFARVGGVVFHYPMSAAYADNAA